MPQWREGPPPLLGLSGAGALGAGFWGRGVAISVTEQFCGRQSEPSQVSHNSAGARRGSRIELE